LVAGSDGPGEHGDTGYQREDQGERRLPTFEPDRLPFEQSFDFLAGLGFVLCNSL
jgi:hypothetical protein